MRSIGVVLRMKCFLTNLCLLIGSVNANDTACVSENSLLMGGGEEDYFCSDWQVPVFRDIHKAEDLIAREIAHPPERQQDMVGICFSGGGSRSLSLVRGQIAALQYLEYWHRVNYVSAISGGAWGAMSYLALPDADMQKDFLGKVVPEPEQLILGTELQDDERNIAWLPEHSLGRAPQRLGLWGFSTYCATRSLAKNTWSEYLSKALMEPYGIKPDAMVSESAFKTKPNHMQFIVNAGLVGDQAEIQPFEITPVAMGARKTVFSLGGYMLPPEKFGCHPVGVSGIGCDSGAKIGFTLKDMFAATSSNYFNMMHKNLPELSWRSLIALGRLIPEYNYPKVDFDRGVSVDSWHPIVDIGWREYLGLMPLLVRQQRKIIAFVNTDAPLVRNTLAQGGQVVGLEEVISSYFGMIPDEPAMKASYQTYRDATSDCRPYCSKNWVFPHDRFAELAEGLWRAKEAGEPLVFLQKDLPVSYNPLYGVPGGWSVDVLWVYNDFSRNWYSHLKDELKDMLNNDSDFHARGAKRDGSITTRFPHFNATSELYLNPRQVNMLFHYASWTLLNSKEKVEQLMNGG